MTDGMQGMLFGTIQEPSDSESDRETIRVCALNVQSTGESRAQRLADWLLSTRSQIVVLSELQSNAGADLLLSCLDAEGYEVTYPPARRAAKYFVAVATKGFTSSTFETPPELGPRVVAVRIQLPGETLAITGIYAPTNGMTHDSSLQRQRFQKESLSWLAQAATIGPLLVAGDLNVLEPGHSPHIEGFNEHDYNFYSGITALGLDDAFRVINPDKIEHSWISERYGSQRLDHAFITRRAFKVTGSWYDHQTRAEGLSDHAAMFIEFSRHIDTNPATGR
ncbi:MAG: endonuclease/exonuclease/phosphatase family protein [Gordonia sp. (in: high G+C Gram-positive bacteria)]